jgi:hypothetical protein
MFGFVGAAAGGKIAIAQTLKILGLRAGATEQEIHGAFIRPMQKVNPDVAGSTVVAGWRNG